MNTKNDMVHRAANAHLNLLEKDERIGSWNFLLGIALQFNVICLFVYCVNKTELKLENNWVLALR